MQAGSDAALIDASRGGDRTAFAQIIERHHRAVYAVAYSGVRDGARADDVTQDTFVLAWRRLDDLRDPERLGAWLCGIARNMARDARRRLHKETLGDATEPVDSTTPFDALSDAESERFVAAALAQVPDVYREPLVLFYYQDRSVEDVARVLGITPATTNKRLSRGRRYLADRVATIVEQGLGRRAPSAALVGSVLAAIALVGPASHVDASTTVKGSTMSKFAIVAALAAATGGTILAASTMSGTDAHAKAKTDATAAQAGAASDDKPCFADFAKLAAAAKHAKAAPSVAAANEPRLTAIASGAPATDCAAVGRHLAELEADATHGPDHRPDDATCEKCAGHYTTMCDAQGWSLERRTCSLAAGDLFNAHLCAATQLITPSAPSTNVPAELQCSALGAHIATTIQSAGMYTDIVDAPQQLDSACQLGGWSIELRKCFAAAKNVATLQACVDPNAH
jgi:RNA polymerase sigma factor (sigma-70 family)